MRFKVINALRIISIIVLVIVFFIAYAGLPKQILLLLDAKSNPLYYLPKNYFFYTSLSVFILSNVLFYVLAVLFGKSIKPINKMVANYVLLLSIVINVFFATALTFIAILNGQENFDYSSFAPFIYLSPALFLIWVLTFLFSLGRLKKND